VKISRVVHGVPKWLMQEYLLELGGQESGDKFIGNGWIAEYRRIQDKHIGSIVIGRFLLEIEGEDDPMNELLPELELKLMRGGG